MISALHVKLNFNNVKKVPLIRQIFGRNNKKEMLQYNYNCIVAFF